MAAVSILFASNILARDNGYDLDFVGEPEYELVNTVNRGGKVIGWSYKVNVKIQNSGDVKSKETIVNLTDEEGISLSKIIKVDPGETKTIQFNWSTLSSKDQKIASSFYPLSLDTSHTSYNSGSTTFTIIIDEKDTVPATSTPGFELIIVLFAITGILILKKKRHR